jgi:hypothetical protein
MVVLLLLLLLRLEQLLCYLRGLPQYCYGGRHNCPEAGVYTIWYFGGAQLYPPLPEDLGITLFFLSASAAAFISLS